MSDAVNLLTCNKMKILIKEINKQTTVQLSKLIQQNAVTPTNSFDRKCINTQNKITLVKPFHGLHAQSMGMWKTLWTMNVLILQYKVFREFYIQIPYTPGLDTLFIDISVNSTDTVWRRLNSMTDFSNLFVHLGKTELAILCVSSDSRKCHYSLVFDYRPGLSCPQANIWQRIPPAGSICTPSYYWQIYADISRANLTSLILCVRVCLCPYIQLHPLSLERITSAALQFCAAHHSVRHGEIQAFHFSLIMVHGEACAY